MSVVGFDLGCLTCFVGVARAGGIETIANEYSDRCTPAYVSMNEKNRCMGVSARNQNTTNLKNTVSSFKRLIGRKFNDPLVQEELKGYFKPYEVVEGPEGEILIQVNYMGEKQSFTPLQMTAMLLTKLKETSETGLKTKVVDVVVSVPAFFTDIERRAMLDACQVAGLNCLKVMSDTTAASLAYGIYKQDLPAETEKARTVVFVDMGYCSTQVAAVAFNKGKLKILGVECDRKLGGRDFDNELVQYFVDDFKTRYKVDAMTRPKALVRLTQECEKMKKLMSANSTPIPINIECFMDDKDVSGRMDREKFEELTKHLMVKTETLFKALLQNTKLSSNDIYSVEVVGGSSRIPAVKNMVHQVFAKDPSTTLNADEAVARGCALQCAILSPTFRVRDFSIIEAQPFPITLSWEGNMDDDNTLEVFPKFHQIPFAKMMTFYRKEPFQLESYYSNAKDVPIPNPHIGHFNVTKVTPQKDGSSSKVKVKVRVNNHGIFTVSSASMTEKLEDETQADQNGLEAMDTDSTEKKSDDNGQGDAQSQNTTDGQTPDETPMQTDQEQQSNEQSSEQPNEQPTEKKSEEKNDEKEEKKKKKKTVKVIDLPVESRVPQMAREQVHLLVEKENQMIMQDKLEMERSNAKNSVEEYVYELREKLYSQLEEFAKEEDRSSFSKSLSATEDWLYDEGEDQSKQVYIDKLAELKKMGNPIQERFNEFQDRPQAFEEFGKSIMLVRKFLDLCSQKDEKYSHIESKDVDKVAKCLKEKEDWYNSKLNQQNSMKTYEKPVVLVSQIRQEKQLLESTCSPIMNKSKPKPKEEPPKDDKKEKKNEKETPMENAKSDEQPTAESTEAPKVDMDID
ncbi:heat shock 70 kDa protein 4-like [Mizuhopecten yessoensis]|uniref:Heat shock 70 kDa protein 4-like HSPA4 n=1 Tax=Mizuhopecten yessoensis TaxID=6573 RepID=A0A210QYX5_MIZYE|nr:heat shock 70 kDa protein 4-like [Mizuhopecten yessoensis]ATD13050.1 heat shock 70 kDa protein 4-like HSPA4 [Mizuhopecten yessoensis]OWF53905.1 Heat shock protein 105 [Mizuhopecten yessoensis]